MRWGCLLVVATACAQSSSGPIASTAHEVPRAEAPAPPPPLTLVPRPPIDMSVWLPDFHEELRWPLSPTQHPAFEPSFAIADALAGPGVTWQDLCKRGAQHRYGAKRDLTTYLRGWCEALDGRVDDAYDTLLPLSHSTAINNCNDIVRTDVANILANSGHADAAEHAINKHKIKDAALLDRLAANYVEVGTVDDAMLINQLAINTSEKTSDAEKCMRWTRHIALLRDRESAYYRKMEPIEEQTCQTLFHKIGCWSDAVDCSMYVADMNWGLEASYLIDAYRLWSTAERDPGQWFVVALRASQATTLPGGAEIAVAALENAERSNARCTEDVRELARGIPRKPELSPRPDLRARAEHVQELCATKAGRAQ